MSDVMLQEQIDAATAYEELFIPAVFGQWAPLVAQAANLEPGQRVLDVACGTGILAREAAKCVGAAGEVTGLDMTPGMLAVAEQLAPDIAWQQGVADKLPFPEESFDAVVSQFGLMFFPDRPKALREMLRVLVPGGRVAIAVFDALENHSAYAEEVALFESMISSQAADAIRIPFGLGDKAGLKHLAEDAGLASVSVATQEGVAKFPSLRTLVEADLRGWLPVMGIQLDEAKIEAVLAEAENVMRFCVNEQGGAELPLFVHIVQGSKA